MVMLDQSIASTCDQRQHNTLQTTVSQCRPVPPKIHTSEKKIVPHIFSLPVSFLVMDYCETDIPLSGY